MEQSLVMYRITKPGHRLDMYIGAQPLSNDDGKVTALTIWSGKERQLTILKNLT